MKLYSWGANNYGQLGLGYICEQCNNPMVVPEYELKNNNIKCIKGGGGHSLILDNDGHVYGCGLNSSNQLGFSDTNDNVLQFKRIKCLDSYKITQISCGWESSFAITEEGHLLVWGSNTYGQLGISTEKNKIIQEPTQLLLSGVVQVSSGLRHTAALLDNGQVMISGSGRKGQLGLTRDGFTVTHTDYFQRVPFLENIKMVACGQNHTMALTYDCKLYAWGDNKHGQLGGNPMFANSVHSPICIESATEYLNNNTTDMQAGWTHSVLLSGNGTIINCGRNSYGQLGILEENRINNWIPQCIPLNKSFTQVAVGSEHNVAVSVDGELLSWGWNEHGNCGLSNFNNIFTPTKLQIQNKVVLIGTGSAHSFALTEK
ncbi:secretion-regulating guanine nucleotide exchange factor-like [Lycorma delicatula]|uniref:secretion-regulating guanine nucleotide exchange factor-like n=1 Tax=Lycorma delicatula TaxID=130591 RepID=UPI003F5189B4